jgi:sulfatase modifying factor 1
MTVRMAPFGILLLTASASAVADEPAAAEAPPAEPAPSDAEPAEVPIEEFESGRIEMVTIAPGIFEMGMSGGFVAHLNSKTLQSTIETGFLVSKYEVSTGLYQSVASGTMSAETPENMVPMTEVTWFDAVQFCNKLSALEGFDPAYAIGEPAALDKGDGQVMSVAWNRDANGYRLPTEAEWEYAARGGTTHAFTATGQPAEICKTDNLLDHTRWESLDQEAQEAAETRGYGPRRKSSHDRPVPCADGNAGVAPVGTYAPNGFGLHDALGNVREWVWAWQNIKRMRTPANSAQLGAGDPDLDKLIARQVMHIVRGHSYIDGLAWAHIGARGFRRAHKSSAKVGFRIVRNAP